jgi:murein L,D-transpeptidase YcbB/YkuD
LSSKVQDAAEILAAAAKAPSLSAHVTQTAAINPFFAALRDAAVKQGATADPHVRATLNRLRLIPAKGKLILVDAANAQLMQVEDGRVVDSMKVIVGKPQFPTPLLAGKIYYVTFNPYWHIPQDVAQRKVAPVVLKRGVSYLKAARYETLAAFGKDESPIDPATVDWKSVADGTVQVHIRQLNGPNNMMGAMKFGFANDYGVYLHDTPHKDLFAKARRNLSLGCVRLEHPDRLAQWLLGRDPTPPTADVEQHVPLDKGVPIYNSYMTARADGDRIVFADDVYGLDSGKPVRISSAVAPDGDAAAR